MPRCKDILLAYSYSRFEITVSPDEYLTRKTSYVSLEICALTFNTWRSLKIGIKCILHRLSWVSNIATKLKYTQLYTV